MALVLYGVMVDVEEAGDAEPFDSVGASCRVDVDVAADDIGDGLYCGPKFASAPPVDPEMTDVVVAVAAVVAFEFVEDMLPDICSIMCSGMPIMVPLGVAVAVPGAGAEGSGLPAVASAYLDAETAAALCCGGGTGNCCCW